MKRGVALRSRMVEISKSGSVRAREEQSPGLLGGAATACTIGGRL